MLSTDGGSPPDTSGRRKRSSGPKVEKTASGKARKSAKQAAVDPGLQNEPQQLAALPVPKAPDALPVSKQPETLPSVHVEAGPADSAASAEPATASVEALARQYATYFETSVQQVRSFCEKFAGVTSVDRAIELEVELMKQGWDSFIANSQKIRELHREIVRREVAHLERCVANMVQSVLPRPALNH